MTEIRGTVYSHTTIRVPGTAQAADVPFALLLVDTDQGGRVLGRLHGQEIPAIGTRVLAAADNSGVPFFREEERGRSVVAKEEQ
jgi:uncharacterized OB-fold protein